MNGKFSSLFLAQVRTWLKDFISTKLVCFFLFCFVISFKELAFCFKRGHSGYMSLSLYLSKRVFDFFFLLELNQIQTADNASFILLADTLQ